MTGASSRRQESRGKSKRAQKGKNKPGATGQSTAAEQFATDHAKFNVRCGGSDIMVTCRERLNSTPGTGNAMDLLHSLVALDPVARPTMKEVLLSDMFMHMRKEEGELHSKKGDVSNRKVYTMYCCEEDGVLVDV